MKPIFVLSLLFLLSNYASSQITSIDTIISIDTTSTTIDFVNGDDPWNGDLCAYIGDPSSGIIDFNIQNFNAVSVTMSTSNLLVVPISNNNLSANLNFANNGLITGGTIFVNPVDAGQSTIIITAFNSDWEAINFYLDITAKTCRDIQTVSQLNINPLNLFFTNTFSANIMTQTSGTVTIPTGSDIEFIAGNNVLLNPGFSVDPGAEFLVDIGPCVVQ